MCSPLALARFAAASPVLGVALAPVCSSHHHVRSVRSVPQSATARAHAVPAHARRRHSREGSARLTHPVPVRLCGCARCGALRRCVCVCVGLEVPVSDAGTALPSALPSLPTHTTLRLTSATLVPLNHAVSDSSLGMVQYLLSASTGSGSKVVLCSLSAARPHVSLDLAAAIGKKTVFTLSTVPTSAAADAKYVVHLSGFSSEAAAAPAAPAAAASKAALATPKAAAEKRKAAATEDSPAAASKQSQQKKSKTADNQTASTPAKKQQQSSDIDDDDEEGDDDEDEPAAAAPAPTPKAKQASTPSTPTTPTAAGAPKKLAIVSLKNGLKLQDTKIGTGKEAVDRSAVGIRYRGTLASNGKMFDSNMPRGQPLRFKIGGGDVIAGFEQGTKGMKVGGTRTVVIPAHLGYGARGAPPDIPPNATLVFDLELVSVK